MCRQLILAVLLLLYAGLGRAEAQDADKAGKAAGKSDNADKSDKAPKADQPATKPFLPTERTNQVIQGWTLRIDDRLFLPANEELRLRTLKFLDAKLFEITMVVPADRVEQLRKVHIVLDLTHGKLGPMQYHPSAGWLKNNGFAEDLAKCVHLPRAVDVVTKRNIREQPWVILHELAHAYHDQVLGFDEPRIKALYEKFKASGRGDKALVYSGQRVKHYGLTTPMEFFAEMTEAYFGSNDFFPFNRAELMEAEPEIHALLAEIWEGKKQAKKETPESVVEVSQTIERLSDDQGKAQVLRQTAATTFGWRMGVATPDVDLNGHALTVETGGGNRIELKGAIRGQGSLTWNGGGSENLQTYPGFLAGDKPNTFTGTLTIERGTLALAKPAGVAAFSGKRLIVGGGANQAIVRLDAADQLPDDCDIIITGQHEGRIWTQGHRETVGDLDLQGHGTIHLGFVEAHTTGRGGGAGMLTFADSSDKKWDLTKTLTIEGWGPGKTRLIFKGKTAGGLTSAQLARIGFADPAGKDAGLYVAKMNAQGELTPGDKVDAVNPPFDLAAAAVTKREAIYRVPGRAKLAGENTPLRDGMSIAFFGDSLTWQNQFIRRIDEALAKGAGTKHMKIRLHNHGINGGGVLSIRDGSEKAAYVNEKNQDGPQLPFAKVIAAEKADIAIIMIGINDIWWRNTAAADFEAALRDIVKASQANKTIPVLATVSAIGEMPDGSNPKDKELDHFAALTRKVAKETGATLINTRAAFIAYLQNHNAKLRIDGSLVMRQAGLLTYDGVHPSDAGNDLLADLMADGIDRALGGK